MKDIDTIVIKVMLMNMKGSESQNRKGQTIKSQFIVANIEFHAWLHVQYTYLLTHN